MVFEPNDEPLWAQIRLNVGAFMHGLSGRRSRGTTPRDVLRQVRRKRRPQNDIDLGIVNIIVGFALKPAGLSSSSSSRWPARSRSNAIVRRSAPHGFIYRQRAAFRSATRTSSSGEMGQQVRGGVSKVSSLNGPPSRETPGRGDPSSAGNRPRTEYEAITLEPRRHPTRNSSSGPIRSGISAPACSETSLAISART